MKKLIVIIFLVFSSSLLTLKAQLDSTSHSVRFRKFSFGFNIGSGLPMSDYGGTGINNLPASMFVWPYNSAYDTNKVNGFAKPGFHLELYASYIIYHHIGLMLSAGGDVNSFDIDTYILKFNNSAIPFTVNGTYYIWQYLIGPYANIPIYKNLSIEFRVLAGITTANYPTLSYPGGGQWETDNTLLKSATGFGYNLGGGIKYTVASGLVGLHLNVNYAGSKITYPGYAIIVTDGALINSQQFVKAYNYNVPKTMELGILQVTMGVSMDL